MPGSALSYNSSSSGSRRAKTRTYYKVAANSQVDESLFGAPNREVQRAKMLDEKMTVDDPTKIEAEADQRQARNRKKNTKKETVKVITKDLIRDLIIPQEDPSGRSLVINRSDFDRIITNSKVLSPEELKAREEELRRFKEKCMEDAQERKETLKLKDIQRRKNEKLNDLEEEEREKSEYLREKANKMLTEQEDEIKHLNEYILNAKCHAIRDAQVMERAQIEKEFKEEEQRLDIMMEADRQNAIKIQEEIEKKRKVEKLIGASKIMEQIQDNEQGRLLSAERKDQENMQMRRYIEKLCEEERDKLTQKKEEQMLLREDLHKCNDEMLKRKQMEVEQEKLIEKNVIEFQKAKAEREAAIEKEQEAIRIEKEKEVARLRSLQERARDEQAERDALRAKRAQEESEREWRRKEAIAARKKAETEAMLKVARAQQMEQKEHFLAVEAQRERKEFERVLRVQHELAEKDRKILEDYNMKNTKFSKEIRAQIKEKERNKIEERNNHFAEGVRLDDEARARRAKLDTVKKQKLEELRSAGIPDKYIAQIMRKLSHPQEGLAA